jgi:hypothetical protein
MNLGKGQDFFFWATAFLSQSIQASKPSPVRVERQNTGMFGLTV